MSLAEGLLLDALYDPPVVSQDVFIAIRSDSSPGAGTFLNPFRGNAASDFDSVMRTVLKNASGVQSIYTTVHLGPGTFETNGTGNTWPTPTSGFFMNNTVRITGSGRDVTTVKLLTSGANAFASPPSTGLAGVEIDNLCIDCQQKGGAIYLTGENLTVSRLKIINFAPNSAVTDRVII